ncbi:MAG: HD domain-containing phosphohydrolase [Chloroherpetonaceae bacterium]|nr:GAF domain-containing protein [Chloroherpetonaceae bacterium]MCS7210721.1 GAF domain-containing protein [Chloroherpetonaceae bacterium]MDW8020115.1 HD domain-containing phosphohydrolase [Chloroherpetonaceae bacterium]
MDTRKILIFDQVGLPAEITQEGLKRMQYAFEYCSPQQTEQYLRTFGASFHLTPVLLLVDATTLHRLKKELPPSLAKVVAIVAVGLPEELESLGGFESWIYTQQLIDFLEIPISSTRFKLLLQRVQAHFHQRERQQLLQREISEQREELEKLTEIGIALSSEQDINKLLEMILSISMEIAGADAGSLYIVEERPGVEFDRSNYLANKQLRFKLAQNISREVPFKEWVMPISPNSIVGYAALSREPLNIPDVYHLPEHVPYSFGGRVFDQSINYRTKSMLTVPMLNRDKETIGVIQLINKKHDFRIVLPDPEEAVHHIIPFTKKDEAFIYALASQAAVAYENRMLYDNIRNLFEGFIKASVTAIEARDPTTSGHSERVAILTVGIAEAVDRLTTGPFKSVQFSKRDLEEIRYASLLHDFGKIGVRERVLVKAKKLYDYELRSIRERYALIKKAIELKYTKQKLFYLMERTREEVEPILQKLDAEMSQKLGELEDYLKFIVQANEPTVMRSEGFGKLREIQSKVFIYSEDEVYPYLLESEAMRLSIPKGSLDEEERREIESHVTHTFNFLRKIPWTNDLRRVPEIAFAHHEKLDGSGYPRKLAAEAIPIQARMMTISDIYDALTAQDRPYKPAVPVERALDILHYEVKSGKVDKDLFEVFVEARIYEKVSSANLAISENGRA